MSSWIGSVEGAKLSSYLARVKGSFELFWSSYRGKLGDWAYAVLPSRLINEINNK